MTDLHVARAGLLVNGQEDFSPLPDSEAQLLRLRDELTAVRAALETAQREHREDVATIGAALIYAANHRDERGDSIDGENGAWCGEYDMEIRRLNRNLVVELPVRERDYIVSTYIRLEISVSATDEDGAQEQAAGIVRRAEQTLDGMDFVLSHPSREYDISRD